MIGLAKGCLRLRELELDRTFSITEEIIHTLCLCGLKGLEAISFTFTPVSAGAIKELLGKKGSFDRTPHENIHQNASHIPTQRKIA